MHLDTDIKYLKAKKFALRILALCKYLKSQTHDYEIAGQLLRSGTSIGANIAEAQYAESPADFIHKLSIAQKECSETKYWIELLSDAGIITERQYLSILNDCNELMKLISSVILSNKAKDY